MFHAAAVHANNIVKQAQNGFWALCGKFTTVQQQSVYMSVALLYTHKTTAQTIP